MSRRAELMMEEGPDEVVHVLASAMRMRKMRALEMQANSARARLSMRKMVSERLSHPLLAQMRSREFEANPLADEDDTLDASAQRLAKDLSEVQKWMLSEGGVFNEQVPAAAASVEAIGRHIETRLGGQLVAAAAGYARSHVRNTLDLLPPCWPRLPS